MRYFLTGATGFIGGEVVQLQTAIVGGKVDPGVFAAVGWVEWRPLPAAAVSNSSKAGCKVHARSSR